MRLFYLLLFFALSAHADDNEVIKRATGISGVNSHINTITNPPAGGCPPAGVEINYDVDDCGSRVPASIWRRYQHNLSQLQSNPKNIEDFFKEVGEENSNAELELRQFHQQMLKMARVNAGLNVFTEQLELEQSIEIFKRKEKESPDENNRSALKQLEAQKIRLLNKFKEHEGLKSLGYKPEDIEKLYEKILGTDMGKSLKKLRDYGVKYNPVTQNWDYSHDGRNVSGHFVSQNVEGDSELKNAAEFMFGKETVYKMLDPRRSDAMVMGNLVITPRKIGAGKDMFASRSLESWSRDVKRNLDICYKNVEQASKKIKKLDTIWDGWVLHSAQSYHNLVLDQLSHLSAAGGMVDALGSLGFPLNERAKLRRQIDQMTTETAATVDSTYQGAKKLKRNLYIIAGGAALAATPGGQTMLLAGLKGGLGYLAAVGAAVPFISEGVKAGVKVSVDGGSWWCQYMKRMDTAATESMIGAVSMAVLPGAALGVIGKLSKSTATILGLTFAGGMMGWGAYGIYGQTVNCTNVLALRNKVLENHAMAVKNGDRETAAELQIFADEMARQAGENCTNAVAGTIDLATGLLSAHLGFKQGRAEANARSGSEITLNRKGASTKANADLSSNVSCSAGTCTTHAPVAMNNLKGKYAAQVGDDNVRFFDEAAGTTFKGEYAYKTPDSVKLQIKVDGKWVNVAGKKSASLPHVGKGDGLLDGRPHVFTELSGTNGKKTIYDPSLADNLKEALKTAGVDQHPVPLDKDGNPLAYFTPEQHQNLLDFTWKLAHQNSKGIKPISSSKMGGLVDPYPQTAQVLDQIRSREMADINNKLAFANKQETKKLLARKAELESVGYQTQIDRSKSAIESYRSELDKAAKELESIERFLAEEGQSEIMKKSALDQLDVLREKQSRLKSEISIETNALTNLKRNQEAGVSYYSGEAYQRMPTQAPTSR